MTVPYPARIDSVNYLILLSSCTMTKGSSLALLLALITLDVRGFLQRHSISLAYVKDCTISRNEKLLGVENEQEEIVDYAAFVSKSKQARTKRKYKVDRTALRWVIESIHKQFNSEHESLAFPDLSSSLMSSLRQLYSGTCSGWCISMRLTVMYTNLAFFLCSTN
jgi:hypothetical protein